MTSVGLAWYGRLFRVTHFIRPSELEANDPPRLVVVQGLNNPINVF